MPDIVHCMPDTVFCTPDIVHCMTDNVFCTLYYNILAYKVLISKIVRQSVYIVRLIA